MRQDLEGLPDISEKAMFGGLCFLLDQHKLCGLHDFGGMYRVGKHNYAAALRLEGVSPLSFTGRPMRGLVEVDEEAMADPARRSSLLFMALDFVGSLPPKPAKWPS